MASSQSSQPKKTSQLSRTVTRALRTLGRSEGIQCTHSLIQTYNSNHAGDEMGIALHQWLDAYVDEFSKWRAECMHAKWIREYALLAMIDVKTSEAAELVRRVYVSLRACIKKGEHCSPFIVIALENMLRVIDTKIVETETQSLVSLANDILSLTNPEECIYTRDTYAFHMACLLTLERILIVLHGVERVHSTQWIVKFFQKRFKAQLNTIAAKQKYYPFVYNTQLIKYNIEGLIKGDRTEMLLNAGRRAFYALCGGLHLFQGIRELAVMRLDFAAIDAGMQRMQQAFGGLMDTRIPGLQEVMQAATKTEESQDFNHVMECYKRHEHPSFMDGMAPEKLKIVKFALVSHLTLFASESAASNLSDHAFRLLSNLAVSHDTAQWRADHDIYECLLDALASVGAKRQSFHQTCLQLLHKMERTSIQGHRTAVKDWRGGYSVQQKLDMKCDAESEIHVPSLCDIVKRQMGLHLNYASNLDLKHELVKRYQDESFAKVSLLLDDNKARHVADFDFHLAVYEAVDAMNQVRNGASLSVNDLIAHNLERCLSIKTSVKLHDIFARGRQKPSGPEEEVGRVLMLGNPGTGKTSLSKRLCYGWATGEWGSEFHQVYLLPIRQLTGSRLQVVTNLEAAISILLFDANCKSEAERNALHRQIKDELDDETTLLILDGLDEASGNDIAEQIVDDALSRSCSILVLSRPHNLGDVQSRMNMQMECLGLDDEQLKACARRGVLDTAEELIKFLKGSPMVWEIGKIPINAHILCTLWNSKEGKSLKELKLVSLKSLYMSMTRYAWQRFVDKTRENVNRQEVFASLEIIAFKSLNLRKVEIPLELVIEHAQGTTTRKLLLDSGFLLFLKKGQVFQFAHLSFHEFFAGCFLAKALQGTEKEIKEAKKYIANRKYCNTSRVTLSFVTQYFCKEEDDSDDSDCIERLKQLLSILDESPLEVVGFQHLMLKMRTLDAFLSICRSCADEIRFDDDLHRMVQLAMTSLEGWLKERREQDIEHRRCRVHATVSDHIIEDLGQMHNLFACFPEFLLTVLKHHHIENELADISKIARLVSYAPEQLLMMKPPELRVGADDVYGIQRIDADLLVWFRLFAESGPDTAVLALEPLRIACQNQREEIRCAAFAATLYLLQVLPDREELHSLCLDAMKDISGNVRTAFICTLGTVTFEPNSVAANLVWTLITEATKDDDEGVRCAAFENVIREDQTSEASIEKMTELMQELASIRVNGQHSSDGHDILRNILKFSSRFPAKLATFLPYLARCCNDPSDHVRSTLSFRIRDLSSLLPTPQTRELGEMISSIYCDVEDPVVRMGLVDALYDIRQQVPDFMADFPDVFSKACKDNDRRVRELARDRNMITSLRSTHNVDAISEVFWDQSGRVKKELLLHIQRESMINAETAKVVMEMALNLLEENYEETEKKSLEVLSSLIPFCPLSSCLISILLDYSDWDPHYDPVSCVFQQPLDTLLEYFWDTSDKTVVPLIAEKLMTASVTCKTARGAKRIISVMENGKNIQQEVPTELLENLIRLVKDDLRPCFEGVLF